MYYNFILLQIAIVLLASRIEIIAALKTKNTNNNVKLNDLSKWTRNPGKNSKLSQHNGQCVSDVSQNNSNEENNGDSTDTNEDFNENGKLSRVELLFGSSGLELLNSSSVFVLGANQLSSKIITHLIRSGVGSIAIWDENKANCQMILKEILLLNPDANIRVLHTDPVTHLDENEYSTVVFSNQPLSFAYELNDKFHTKSNFVYASVAGTYGLVMNDFGRHRVTIPSDDLYPEHSCSLIHSGNETCLEIRTGSNVSQFQKNDTVEVKYRDKSSDGSSYKIKSHKYKILNVVKSNKNKNKAKVWISTKNNKIDGDVLSVRKVDDEVVVNFNRFEAVIKSLFNLNWFQRFVRSVLNEKKDDKNSENKTENKKAERLVISPSSGNLLDEKSLSVLSSFLSMSTTNLSKLDKDYDLDVHNFYSIAKGIYPNSDYNVVSNFNTLKRVDIPSMNSLVGALTAQEAIKGITHIFTPSEMILVDRSDLFTDESGKIDPEKVKYSVDQVSKLSFLLIGAGALGCDYLKLLAEMGVKDVTVVDNDTVDVSNLSRQSLFTINDIGKPKAQSALRNLSLIHNTKGYKHYNMLFSENSFDLVYLKSKENKNLVAISAMDNIEGRVALDNYCVQNNIPLVESGIYGMKCSTSFTFPRITESYSSSMGDQPLSGDRYSCSVKGIPSTIDDCVFYSIELFSWIFNTQHMIFNNFIRDPIKSVQLALDTGSDYFYNLVQIVYENLEILNCEDESKLEHRLKMWANKTYDKYVGYQSEFKDLLVSNLVKLKAKSLKKVGSEPLDVLGVEGVDGVPGSSGQSDSTTSNALEVTESKQTYPSFDYDKFKSLLNQGFGFGFDSYDQNKLNNKFVDKNTFLKAMDEYINNSKNKMKDYGDRSSSSFGDDSNKNMELVYHLDPLVIQEDCRNCTDFIFLVSNFRARRFNIPESDKKSLVQKARNIVPAVSTCVSVAASLSLMELYKLHLVGRSKLSENAFINDFKKNKMKQMVMRNNELVASDHVELNKNKNKNENKDKDKDNDKNKNVNIKTNLNLYFSVYESEIKFYNGDKPILTIESFDYDKHKHLSSVFNNYFFNTATLKFTSNVTEPPKVFKIKNKRSLLDGLSISYWDYLIIKEPRSKPVEQPVSKKRYNWLEIVFKSLFKALFGIRESANDFIYLYELVDTLQYIFDVKVDALTFSDGYVLVNDSNMKKLLKDLVNHESGDMILHIIARDYRSNKIIELPDVKYIR